MAHARIQQSRSLQALIQRISDVVVIGTTLFVSQWLAGQDASDKSFLAIAVAVCVFFLVSEASSLYRFEESRSANSDLILICLSWLTTVMILSAVAFFTRHGEYFARSSMLSWIVLTGAMLGLSRMLLRIATEILAKQGYGRRRCAIAGLNSLGLELLHNAESNP